MRKQPVQRDLWSALGLASKISLTSLLVGLSLLTLTLRADDQAYLARLPDLPLMPGLTEIEDAGLTFDKPDGRIVEAYAGGLVERLSVRAYYDETLPQLGWEMIGKDAYEREGERLRLEYLGSAERLTLRFVLTPQ